MKQHNLNMVPGGVPAIINVSQFDVNRQWRFNLYYADDVYTIPPGATIRIDGTKPDNKGFSYNQSDGVVETGADYVIVNSTAQMSAVAGDVRCELRVQQGDKEIGTANFIIRVEKAAIEADTDMSETEIPAIVDAATQQMIAAARSAEAAKASENAAKASEEAADESADIAKSWATYQADPAARGSDTNNAQYWSDQAKITLRHTQSSMTTAEAAALAAQSSMTMAEAARDKAKDWADTAEGFADHAQSSMTMAKAARDKAKDWADTAEGFADHAQSSMTMAEAARDKAKDWADTSETHALHAQSSMTSAWIAADSAKNWSEVSEGWADQAQSSLTMTREAAAHAQSSKTMAEAARDAAKASEDAAKDEADRAKSWAVYEDDPDAWGSDTNNAQYWADHAQSSLTMAEAARELARLWAQGPSGTGTPSDTNNAEYWAHEAQSAAGGGVTSWNTRTGGVLPQAGDYSASQISYDGGFVDEKKADVNSPTLTGEPRSTTPPDGDNSTRIATTEFVYRAGGGSVITVTTTEATLYGKEVTLTNGTEIMTETFSATGSAIFRGVRMSGTLTVSSTDGTDTAAKTFTIPYYGTYAVSLVFEYATIRITTSDPLLIGRTAYVYDNSGMVAGSVALTAGSGEVIVHDTGHYTVRASSQGISTESAVTVTTFFETYGVTLSLAYATLNITTSETTLYNQAISVKSNGSVVATGTFDSGGRATIYTGTTGLLTIESTDRNETATASVTVAAGQSYSVTLAFEYATIVVSTTDHLLQGAQVTASDGSGTYTGSFVNGQVSIVVKDLGTYTISASAEGISGTTTAQVEAFFTTVNATLNLRYATLNIAAGEASLYGKTAQITYNSTSKTVNLDSSGHATAYIGYAGAVTVSATDGTDTATANLTTVYGQTYSVSLLFSYATIHVTTSDPLLEGVTVNASINGTSYSGVMTSGACDIVVKDLGTYTISATAEGFTASESVAVEAFFNTYNKAISLPYATLNVTTSETKLYGKTISVKSGSVEVASGAFSGAGSATIRVGALGTLTITSTDGTDTANTTVNVAAYQTTYNADLSFLKIVTWASGTDEEVAAMIEADRAGKIDLYDYWAVGDTRNVQISAMAATGVGESHEAQTVQLVLVAKNVVDLAAGGKCKFVFQLKNGLGTATTERGYMNSSNTNVGGWKDCARRTWCNSVFYNALPAWLRGVIREASIKTSQGNQLTTFDTTTDKCFLPCEYNIFGTTTYSVAGEDTVHWEWYQTAANRIKKQGSDSGSAYYWWERSPRASNAAGFCRVYASGTAGANDASFAGLLAPCSCI